MNGPLGVADLCSRRFEAPKEFLPPLIKEGQIGMIYAGTGVGKTHFASALAAAAASPEGYFLKWRTVEACRVLYLDGEMTLSVLQERYLKLAESIDFSINNENLMFLAPDMFTGAIPNIAIEESQNYYDSVLDNFQVLIIDNLCSCAFRLGNESDAEMWARIRPWLIRLRARRKCVVIVHHAGKSGDQLGTSEKTQLLDWTIKLRRPADYSPSEGARFDLIFEKARGLFGDDVDALSINCLDVDNRNVWSWEPLEKRNETLIADMHAVGMGVREIADNLGVSSFFVRRVLSDARFKEITHNNTELRWEGEND